MSQNELIEGTVVSNGSNGNAILEGIEIIENILIHENVSDESRGQIIGSLVDVIKKSYTAGAEDYAEYLNGIEQETRRNNGHTMGFSANR